MANPFTSNETVTKLLDTNANPAPLGLMGFGLTTVLLNIHNAGFFELNAMILAMGIFYGGIAQIIAGIMEWRKNNTFGTLAFTSYGFFWLTLAGIWLFPTIFEGAGAAAAAERDGSGLVLRLLGPVHRLHVHRHAQAEPGAAGGVRRCSPSCSSCWPPVTSAAARSVGKIAGCEGILTGLAAVYAAMAQILNETYKRVLLPLGSGQPAAQGLRAGLRRRDRRHVASELFVSVRRPRPTAWSATKSWSPPASSPSPRWTSTSAASRARPTSAPFFHKLGATRAAQGLPLPELISAILLLKREIWMSARTHGVWESAMDLQRAVDLNRELGRFFDRAVYYATAGYTGYPLRPKDVF